MPANSKNSPKISICIPTRDRKHLLSSALESVLNQTIEDFEIIVCDDGSIDDTTDYVRSICDRRIRLTRHERPIGKSNNMKSGFDVACGRYFVKCDDDDRLTSTFLAKTSEVLDRCSDVDFVSTDHWVIDSQGSRDLLATENNSRYWGRSTLREGIISDLLRAVFAAQSLHIGATIFRRKVLVEVGFMLATLQNCEDIDLLVRLALAGKVCYYVPELLMEYRIHPGQQGLEGAIRFLRDKIQYLERYRFDDSSLELVRNNRLRECRLALGVRLIRAGNDFEGAHLRSTEPSVTLWNMDSM